MTLIDYFVKGGIVMYPLAVFFIVSVVLIVERSLFFLTVMVPETYLRNVRSRLVDGDYDAALETVGDKKGPIPSILRRGIGHLSEYEYHHGARIADFERFMKEAMMSELTNVYRNNGWLGIIAHAAPLLGLLGTVVGLLDSFMVLAEMGRPDVSALSGGIGVALITTVTGLIVGIVAFLTHEHFNLRADGINLEMERICVEMANAIMHTRVPEVGDIQVTTE